MIGRVVLAVQTHVHGTKRLCRSLSVRVDTSPRRSPLPRPWGSDRASPRGLGRTRLPAAWPAVRVSSVRAIGHARSTPVAGPIHMVQCLFSRGGRRSLAVIEASAPSFGCIASLPAGHYNLRSKERALTGTAPTRSRSARSAHFVLHRAPRTSRAPRPSLPHRTRHRCNTDHRGTGTVPMYEYSRGHGGRARVRSRAPVHMYASTRRTVRLLVPPCSTHRSSGFGRGNHTVAWSSPWAAAYTFPRTVIPYSHTHPRSSSRNARVSTPSIRRCTARMPSHLHPFIYLTTTTLRTTLTLRILPVSLGDINHHINHLIIFLPLGRP